MIVPLVIILVIAGVAGGYSVSTLSTVAAGFGNADQGYNPPAFLAANNGTVAIATVLTGLGIIGGVFLMIIIISALTSLGKSQ